MRGGDRHTSLSMAPDLGHAAVYDCLAMSNTEHTGDYGYGYGYGDDSRSDATTSSTTPTPEPSLVAAGINPPFDAMGADLTDDDVRSLAYMCDLLPMWPDDAVVGSAMAGGGGGPTSPPWTQPPRPLSEADPPAMHQSPYPTNGYHTTATAAAPAAAIVAAAATADEGGAPRKFWCPFPGCAMKLSRPSHLEKHVRTHTNERPHRCSTCDMAFKTKWTLKKHLRIHSGEKPYTCEHPGCGKAFTQRGTYRRHQRLHSDEASAFQCHCGKAFKQRSNYTMHLQSHSTTREFPCNLCPKAFKSPRSLEKHQLLHVTSQKTTDGRRVELRKHYCRYCAKAFHYVVTPDGSISEADRDHFVQHEGTHTAARIGDPSSAMPTLSMSMPSSSSSMKQEQSTELVLKLC
jgi:uncharacterized C2H2 Zn-finger protein